MCLSTRTLLQNLSDNTICSRSEAPPQVPACSLGEPQRRKFSFHSPVPAVSSIKKKVTRHCPEWFPLRCLQICCFRAAFDISTHTETMALIVYVTGACFPLSIGYCQLRCSKLDTAFSFESGGGLGLNTGHYPTALVRDLRECFIAAVRNCLDGCSSAVSYWRAVALKILACWERQSTRLPLCVRLVLQGARGTAWTSPGHPFARLNLPQIGSRGLGDMANSQLRSRSSEQTTSASQPQAKILRTESTGPHFAFEPATASQSSPD